MASSLANDHGNTSMSLDLQILQVARPQHIHSHFARCTRVPWHSLTSMVSCITLVNGMNQWPVIQWFLFMLDINTFFRMIRIVPRSLVADEDYTLFHDSLSSYSSMNSDLWEYHSSTFSIYLFHDSTSAVQIPSFPRIQLQQHQSHFPDPAEATATFLLNSSSFLGK